MGRRKTQVSNQNFSGGLITEVNSVATAPNTFKILDNYIVNNDGSAQRRLGLGLENSSNSLTHPSIVGVLSTVEGFVSDSIVTTYLWKNVNNDPTANFNVVQIGFMLYFMDAAKDISLDNIIGSVQIPARTIVLPAGFGATIYVTTPPPALEITDIDGKLICAGENYDVLEVTYDPLSTPPFSLSEKNLVVRDIWGVYDGGGDIASRPSTLTDAHKYNLINQGWSETKINDFFTAKSVYPSNADLVQLGKKSDGTWDASLITGEFAGRTPAPKGKVLLHYTRRGEVRKRVDLETGNSDHSSLDITVRPVTLPTLPIDRDQSGVTAVAKFSQRVFYAGVVSNIEDGDENSPNYTGAVFFSKTVLVDDDIYHCYQEADPTADTDNELVDTDGGYIKISGAGVIRKMVPIGGHLIVFASNGIWDISSPDESFTATSFSVNQLSTTELLSKQSVVVAKDKVFFFAKDGLNVVAFSNEAQRMQVANISDARIKTLISDISQAALDKVFGVYDGVSNKIHWLFNDNTSYTGADGNKFNRELIFDLKLEVFYTNTYPVSDDMYVVGMFTKTAFNVVDIVNPVTVNGVQVTVNGADVNITTQVRSRGSFSLKYLVFRKSDDSLVIGQHTAADFKDFGTTDAKAVAQPNNYTFDDIMLRKMSPFVGFAFKRTESGFTDDGNGNLTPVNESSCLVTPIFDYADSDTSGKIGGQFQAYRLRRKYIPTGSGDPFDYGQDTVVTKSRVRGTGKSITFKIESEPQKDLYIYSWSMVVEGETDE